MGVTLFMSDLEQDVFCVVGPDLKSLIGIFICYGFEKVPGKVSGINWSLLVGGLRSGSSNTFR